MQVLLTEREIKMSLIWAAKYILFLLVGIACLGVGPLATSPAKAQLEELVPEPVSGDGIWLDPRIEERAEGPQRIVVWFDQQLLGDGAAYARRAKQLAGSRRTQLREVAVTQLKRLSDDSYAKAEKEIQVLIDNEVIANVQRHWIINGFSCNLAAHSHQHLAAVPGVKKVFSKRQIGALQPQGGEENASDGDQRDVIDEAHEEGPRRDKEPRIDKASDKDKEPFDPERYQHPWYIHQLLVDRVWKDFGITGAGTLNVIQDGNFVLSPQARLSLYVNPGEKPGNGVDDDGNGLIDDVNGYDFRRNRADLTRRTPPAGEFTPPLMHGHSCALIISGRGTEEQPYELGLAPESHWAGVLAGRDIEPSIEWAVEQHADTYSMSFSIPDLGELRSHYRKAMEHGSLCGIYFVSGAGNFAMERSPQFAPVPVQMRVPEDIPEVVFAAAGVQRDLSRTPFSSQGPVEWQTEHYQDGSVQKPEVCAFNMQIPTLTAEGELAPIRIDGNSFAGPMFCGTISLMLNADPDLLPWDLKEIVTSTATDVGPEGVDYQTGYGLINAYRAVKEVLRRKAIREGEDPTPYTGRVPGDEIDPAELQQQLGEQVLSVARLPPDSPWVDVGLKEGDVLLKIDDTQTKSPVDFIRTLGQAFRNEQDQITLEIKRGGETMTLQFKPFVSPFGLENGYSAPEFR